jgi:hypothetical protein
MENPLDVYRRQTGLLVMLTAGLFWLGVVMLGFAGHVSFFSTEEYLRQPMWTQDIHWIVRGPLTVTALMLGASNVGLLVVAGFGLVLLSTRFRTILLFRSSVALLTLITANALLYEAFAIIGYRMARGRPPAGYSTTLTVVGITMPLLAALSAFVWLSGRRMARTERPAD